MAKREDRPIALATFSSSARSSSKEGDFTFAGVQVGTYSITVSAPGFQFWRVIDVLINSGDNGTGPDIKLRVGETDQTFSVTISPAQIVTIDSGARSYVLSSKDLNKLPLEGRDVSEALKLLPGSSIAAVASGSGGGTPPP